MGCDVVLLNISFAIPMLLRSSLSPERQLAILTDVHLSIRSAVDLAGEAAHKPGAITA